MPVHALVCVSHAVLTRPQCEDVCTSLYESVEKPSLRWQSLDCIPMGTPQTHELRRRLAAVFLFDEVLRARQNPEESFSFRAIIDRLDTDDFYVSRSTDHQDLAAMFRFLDIVIDDGGRSPPGDEPPEFDTEIDDLTECLGEVLRRIGTNPSATTKLEARQLLQNTVYRLTHSVRTKPLPKKDIYAEKEESIDRQQEHMRRFLSNGASKA